MFVFLCSYCASILFQLPYRHSDIVLVYDTISDCFLGMKLDVSTSEGKRYQKHNGIEHEQCLTRLGYKRLGHFILRRDLLNHVEQYVTKKANHDGNDNENASKQKA